MHIRPRRDDDLEHLVEVLRRTHDEDGYPARWPDDPASWLTPPGHLAAWTAWSSGSVVGHVGLAAPDPDAAPLVTRLVVHRDHRGLGIADALLATAEAAAAEQQPQPQPRRPPKPQPRPPSPPPTPPTCRPSGST